MVPNGLPSNRLGWLGRNKPAHPGWRRKVLERKEEPMGFPGGPVVKTLRFHCRGCGFDLWSGN